MQNMRIILAVPLALYVQIACASAQQAPQYANVLATCGSASYTAGSVPRPVTMDTTGNTCTSASGGGGTSNVNVTQVGGNAVATGNGTTTTGTQRVTISSDSTGQVTSNQGTAAAVSGGWPVISGEPADTTGTFTNATQATAITTPSVDGYETATITINGTYNTATATFLASDDGGTTYYTLSCARTDSSVVETGYTSLTNTNRAWFCPIHSFDTIRVQSSAVTSGTVNVRISISSPPTTDGAVVSVSSSSTIGVEGADGSTQASPTNALPVGPAAGTSTDIGGTVTLGGTYQTASAASATRKNCTIQNPSTATEVLNVKFGTMTNPYVIDPGGSISALNGVVVATDAITLTAATTAHSYSGTCQ